MDHSCYKCGLSVEDGKPFCAQCGAPQIRVAVSEPTVPQDIPTEALDPEIPAVFSGTSIPVLPSNWSRIARPSALAAAVAAFLMALGLHPFVAALGAGFLAVSFSRGRGPSISGSAAGMRLGALSGIFLFFASAILETLAVTVLHKGPEIRSAMMEKVQQAAARYPGPDVQPFEDFVKSPGGFEIMLAASLIFGFLAFIVLGGIGGAVGSALLGRRNRP
jgi:hypothetical protein